MKDSIKSRLVSDVPLGVFLSGGLDSSSIVSIMSQAVKNKIKTFSIGFKEKDYNETVYSRQVARQYNTEHHELIIEPDAVSILPKLVEYFDEPIDDSSVIPTYYLAKFTRQHVTVALSGDGADELLAGYRRYFYFQRQERILSSFPEYVSNFSRICAKFYPEHLRGKRLLYLSSLDRYDRYGEFINAFTSPELEQLVGSDLLSSGSNKAFVDFTSPMIEDMITQLQNIDRQTYLLGDIIAKIDRVSMANSLEVRSPFLDYRLWELVFSLPPQYRVHNGQGKHMLKEVMKNDYNQNFLNRKKMGFSVPLNYWFKGKLKEYAKNILFDSSFIGRGFFNERYVRKLFQVHEKGKRDFSRKIWNLIFLEHWFRKWL